MPFAKKKTSKETKNKQNKQTKLASITISFYQEIVQNRSFRLFTIPLNWAFTSQLKHNSYTMYSPVCKIEGVIKNGKSRNTGNIGIRDRTKTNKTKN
jgi:hypothetical protein